jgi:hypothetical protein
VLPQIGSKQELEQRRSELHTSRQDALQQINQHKGSLGVVAQNAREAKKSLSDPRYHKIAERYRKQLVEVRATVAARVKCESRLNSHSRAFCETTPGSAQRTCRHSVHRIHASSLCVTHTPLLLLHGFALQLKTTELAAADLNKYHKALERALLAFHTGMCSTISRLICFVIAANTPCSRCQSAGTS